MSTAEHMDLRATVAEVMQLREANTALHGSRARVALENTILRAERDRYIEALLRISRIRDDDPFAADAAAIAAEALRIEVAA